MPHQLRRLRDVRHQVIGCVPVGRHLRRYKNQPHLRRHRLPAHQFLKQDRLAGRIDDFIHLISAEIGRILLPVKGHLGLRDIRSRPRQRIEHHKREGARRPVAGSHPLGNRPFRPPADLLCRPDGHLLMPPFARQGIACAGPVKMGLHRLKLPQPGRLQSRSRIGKPADQVRGCSHLFCPEQAVHCWGMVRRHPRKERLYKRLHRRRPPRSARTDLRRRPLSENNRLASPESPPPLPLPPTWPGPPGPLPTSGSTPRPSGPAAGLQTCSRVAAISRLRFLRFAGSPRTASQSRSQPPGACQTRTFDPSSPSQANSILSRGPHRVNTACVTPHFRAICGYCGVQPGASPR